MRSHNLKGIYYAFVLLFLIITLGIIGYMIIEEYDFTEAVYMTIITVATVGFKEVRTLSPPGMWFTSFLIIVSFGIFAYVITTFTRFVVDGELRLLIKRNRVRKQIKKLNNHVIVCGYGRNGKQAAKELTNHKIPFIIIERDPDVIEKIKEDPELLYIEGNATHDEVLELSDISSARALITTFPNDADNLFVVLSAREINPDITIISRASEDHSDNKLKRAGADNVIMPDKLGGQQMAKLVAQPDIVEFLDYIMLQSHEEVSLEEVSCENLSACFANKSIRELDVRNVSGANIVGLRTADGNYLINPLPDVILTYQDKLFVLSTAGQLSKLKHILQKTN